MYKEKEMKATGIKLLEGLLGLIVFMITFAFKMFDVLLKIIAFFTFDR